MGRALPLVGTGGRLAMLLLRERRRLMPRLLPRSLILIAAVAIPASAATDHVLCRTIRLPHASAAAPAFLPFSRLAVADRFTPEGRLVDVRKPTSICVPVGAEGTAIDPAATFLAGYETRPSRTKPPQSHFQGRTVDVQTPWSAEQLRVLGRDDLRVPALAAADPDDPGPAADLDQFACYDVRTLHKFRARMVELAGAGNPAVVEITRAVRLCLPADLAGTNPLAVGKTKAWLCLAARLPRDSGPRADDTQGDVLTIRDRFGLSTMTLGASSELCVTAAIGGPLEADRRRRQRPRPQRRRRPRRPPRWRPARKRHPRRARLRGRPWWRSA